MFRVWLAGIVPDQFTVVGLTVQLPMLVTQVPGKPMIVAGRAVVTVPVCAITVVLVRLTEPLTLLPGPVQASGSARLAVGAGVNVVTVTVKVQFESGLFGLASDTVQVTVVVPTGKLDPEAGTQFGEPTPGQLSLTVGAG